MAKKKELELEKVQEAEIVSADINENEEAIPQTDMELAGMEGFEDAVGESESNFCETETDNDQKERDTAQDQEDSDDSHKTETAESPESELTGENSAKQKRGRKKSADVVSNTQTESAAIAAEDAAGSTKAKKNRPAVKPKQSVVAIDDVRLAETDADRIKSDLLDLTESLKTGRILSGTIQGVEKASESNATSLAVIYHGSFKVIIPASEAVNPPEDYRGMDPDEVHHYLLTKRLGAEVDYIIKGIDAKAGIAVASRLEAMKVKRKRYYFAADREGNNLLYEGACAEARVVSVIRAGIFADVFGAEVYIPLKELSYQRVMDAAGYFQPGQRILVKLLSVDRIDKENVKVTASVKQASENPYEQALKRYTVGNRYVGSVSMVDTNGVFVALDGGIDCLCSYPKRGRPPRGARVTVRILGINRETNRIWGAITHIAMPH